MSEKIDIPLDSSNFSAEENSSDDDVEEELKPHGKKKNYVYVFLKLFFIHIFYLSNNFFL